MGKQLLITIITVCYNSENTISKTLESILKQTYDYIEYIVIDGKSTDKTTTIIKSYESDFQKKEINFKWLSEKDNGIYDAMNKGLQLATGDVIGIIGSDDTYNKEALQKVAESYSINEPDIIYGDLNFCSVQTNTVKNRKSKTPDALKLRMCIYHPSTFITKKLYLKIGVYNQDYKIAADYDLLLRAYKARANFIYVPYTFANFSLGGISSVQLQDALFDEEQVKRAHGYNSILDRTYYLLRVTYSRLISFKSLFSA